MEHTPYLDTRAAAEYLGVSMATMQAWRLKKIGPPFRRLNARSVRYELRDLNKWMRGFAKEQPGRPTELA